EVLMLRQAQPSDYGALLLKIVQQPPALQPSGLAAMQIAESYSTVKRRLIAMNHSGRWSYKYAAAVAPVLAIAGLIAVLPWQVVAQETQADHQKLVRAKLEGGTGLPVKLIDALQLNDRQLDRIRGIHEAAMREITRTLTPNQQAQLKASASKI